MIPIATFYEQLNKYIGESPGIKYRIGEKYYNSQLPQHVVLPAMTFELVSSEGVGVKNGPDEYYKLRIQFNTYGPTLSEAVELQDEIRRYFERYRNENDTVKFHQTFFLDKRAPVWDEDQNAWWVSADYEFQIK